MADTGAINSWETRSLPPALADDEVQVWYFPLGIPAGCEAEWNDVLSPTECERAGRFAFPYLRERYVAAHAILRRLLGGYLNANPAALNFRIADRGKPSLADHELHFNLSHTQDVGLLAVTRLAEVGVDVEFPDRRIDRHGIAKRFFSEAEAAELASLPEAEQGEGFFHLWTRKEAWLKATGLGISEGLNKVEFNCHPGEPARLLRIDGDADRASGWWIESLRPPGGCVAAVAMHAGQPRVRCYSMPSKT